VVAAKRVSHALGYAGEGATKHTRKADRCSLRTRRFPATQDNPRPASPVHPWAGSGPAERGSRRRTFRSTPA